MKQYFIIFTVFIVLLFATPIVFGLIQNEQSIDEGSANDNVSEEGAKINQDFVFPKSVSLMLSDTGEILELSIEEYLVGALFAQIQVDFHEEALKAQAVAAHTYLIRLLMNNNNGNVISDNPNTCQPFFDTERARNLFPNTREGLERFDEISEKVKSAAQHGANRILFHEGEPIYAVYHSISAGVTNTAYSVWGVDFPYLRSVDSSWDREHPDFHCSNEISSESVRLAMFDFNRTASMPADYEDWFKEPQINEFGYVISVGVGEHRLSGGDAWRAFGLRSTAFEFTQRETGGSGIFIIETRGFGHGVGLSQHGADVLARRGFSYADILLHYYTGVELVDVR
ncbi:MAG: SpoIID/LytB domain-containing protein [Oscillospiraceae bacterium]|nr:SpoIID/LytB domain-containing protein [Oscillospiraceae bacterium]